MSEENKITKRKTDNKSVSNVDDNPATPEKKAKSKHEKEP